VHPSEAAVGYIWEYFAAAFFSTETRDLLAQLDKIRTAAGHRPLHPDTPAHHAFARQQLAAIEGLKAAHPALDFSTEIAWFEQFSS